MTRYVPLFIAVAVLFYQSSHAQSSRSEMQESLRDANYWRSRYEQLVRRMSSEFETPQIGSTITIYPTIGKPIKGKLTDLAVDSVTVGTQSFRAHQLTSESRIALFANDWASVQARAAVLKKKEEYEKEEKQRRAVHAEQQSKEAVIVQAAIDSASGEDADWNSSIVRLETAMGANPNASNIQAAQELLDSLRKQRADAISVKIDKFTGTHTYQCVSGWELADGLILKVRAYGTADMLPHKVTLHFIYSGSDWEYLRFRALYLLYDKKKLSWASDDIEHDGNVHTGSVLEQMHVDVPLEDFREFAEAQVAEGRLGITTFSLSYGQRKWMRALCETITAKTNE